MKFLVLGGTVFVGRHFVEAALARGHAVTLFNRGLRNPDLFPELEKLCGDRDGDLSALQGRSFDAVFDPSGYKPEQITALITALGGRVPHYTFVSSISAYSKFPPGRSFDVDAPLAAWCVRLAEERRVGRLNAIGPKSRLTMGEFLEACRLSVGRDTRMTWVSDDDLIREGVEPWSEMPLWMPEADPSFGGVMLGDNRRSVAAGLTFRSAADTIRATLEWDAREGGLQGSSPSRVTPISRDREAAIMEKLARRV